ncbi:F-box protein At5g49610-like [Punica granatum]|uniref:F-box domain-containing protein n=2 Tax=Punica granatum TaxID=22663 RepID=A0A218WV55_PUNGR|nr:F-box protein At5g49610-like [Punica granatum]OWM76476.1 hypothetical protein CDL15_Pgr005440 [Punica granatum]PKI71053.1 hypothetical protein CRG98_008634 [Punica granatum]
MDLFSSLYLSARNFAHDVLYAVMETYETEDDDQAQPTVATLPTDVLTEILLRLPAENLVQLKSVCKRWHRLINSKDFAELHLQRWRFQGGIVFKTRRCKIKGKVNRACHELFFCFSLCPYEFYLLSQLSFEYNGGDLNVYRQNVPLENCLHALNIFILLDSCNGLVLCGIPNREPQLFICNPVTRSYRLLPSPDIDCNLEEVYWTFTHDLSDKKYRILGLSDTDLLIFELHEDKDRQTTWKKLHISSNIRVFEYDHEIMARVFVNGKIHFLVNYLQDDGDERAMACMCSFDIKMEEVQDVVYFPELRPLKRRRNFKDALFASNGMFYIAYNLSGKQLDLWVLRDVENPKWSRLREIQLESAHGLLPMGEGGRFGCRVRSMTILGEGSSLLVKYGKKMFVCDMSSGEWKRVSEVFDAINTPGFYGWHMEKKHTLHVSSLISWGNYSQVVNQPCRRTSPSDPFISLNIDVICVICVIISMCLGLAIWVRLTFSGGFALFYMCE